MIVFDLSEGMENLKMSGKSQGSLRWMISGNPDLGLELGYILNGKKNENGRVVSSECVPKYPKIFYFMILQKFLLMIKSVSSSCRAPDKRGVGVGRGWY